MNSRPSPLEQKTGVSAARRVYLDLRQRILDTVLLPGVRINEKQLAEELGTSRTPVHEAVQRLAEEGLIEVLPRVGTFVARIPLDALDDAMLVRSALEGAIVEKATHSATPKDVAGLRAILAAQAASIANDDLRAFHRTDEDFHAALAGLAGHPGVWPLVSQARSQIDRYRQLALPLAGRANEVLAEHAAVVEAIAAGDAAAAVSAMRSHLAGVLPTLDVARQLRPEFFTPHLKRPR
jgi:DNA-binding GntR family transcriptional regulator